MTTGKVLRAGLGASLLALLSTAAFAAERVPMSVPAGKGLPIVKVSSSAAFDRACPRYYRQGNDANVSAEFAEPYCNCIASTMESQGLGDPEVMDFLARTYSEDLTAFIDEYPNGDAWMEAFFAAAEQCNNQDYGSNEPPADGNEPNPPPGAIPAGSWGGIVREGPGQNYRRLASLNQGEHVMLLENTGVYSNGFPWWYIEFWGNRTGYQWGGILCSLNAPMEGIYETCY
jgi:hypothetical protein